MLRGRGWRVPAVGVLGAAVVAGAIATASQPSSPDERPAAGRGSTSAAPSPSSTVPVVLSSCFVPSTPTNVSFGTAEAMELMTLAAGVRDVEQGRGRVEAAVALAAPDVTADQVAAATDSLLGLRPANRLTCAHPRAEVEPERMGPNGLTPRAQRLRRAWTAVFGPIVSGGFAGGGVRSGHVDGSSHYDGRAVDVFFRPLGDPEQERRGLVLAQWLVAHAERYHVLSVIHRDRIWTSWAAYLGWRDYVHPSGDTRNPVLRHLEHVHVAVESGEPYRGG